MNNADERLLAAGNLTHCPTIVASKKMAADYRKHMSVDENIFMACRIYRRVFAKWDKEAKKVPGRFAYIRNSVDVGAPFF
jgi:hypothetical protein